jgi:outer membrane lipoprotein-sorting protein
MEHGFRLGRRARWAVPAGAIVAVGAVIAGTAVAGAQTTPVLPARSAAQLLADVQRASGPGPLTATLQETASLGLPDLPSSDSSSSALSLLSGSHAFTIWYADPAHVRVAEPVQLGESDLRVDGRQVWLWNSSTQTATHVVLPSTAPTSSARFSSAPAGPATAVSAAAGSSAAASSAAASSAAGSSAAGSSAAGSAAASVPTPQQLARQILAAVGPTSVVSVQRNVMVAGQAAYQLAIAPKSSRSLIGQVTIAIDASKSFPLRVQVFARGATSPAFSLGFTSLTFGRPAASNFAFTPPAGAKVKTVTVPAGRGALPFADLLSGLGGPAGVRVPPLIRLGHAGRAGYPAGFRPGAPNIKSGSAPTGSLSAKPGSSAPAGGTQSVIAEPAGGSRPTVMGQGWLSVLVFSPATTVRRFTVLNPQGMASRTVVLAPATGTATTAAPGGHGQQVSPDAGGPAAALLKATTPVHGAWGSGRLLRTSLFSVLITSKGEVLAGAVTPAVLYADAAALK